MATDPKPADLIEIFRRGYQHWAIYVGDGYVVHFTSNDSGTSSSGFFGFNGVVRRDKLVKVVGTDKWRVNNKTGKPLPVAEILERCHQMVNKEMSYGILNGNCEHFVTDLRFGEPHSEQVERFEEAASVLERY